MTRQPFHAVLTEFENRFLYLTSVTVATSVTVTAIYDFKFLLISVLVSSVRCQIDFYFQPCNAFHYFFKAWLFSKKHILHMLVIVTELIKVIFGWHQTHCSTLCKIVSRPRATVELVLKTDDTRQQIVVCQGVIAEFSVQASRETCFDLLPVAKEYVEFDYTDRTQNPYEVAYLAAKETRVDPETGGEYNMSFLDWEDDIVSTESDVTFPEKQA